MRNTEIKNKINDFYKEYCKFANITNPAQMSINFINQINPYVELNEIPSFNINPNLFKLNDNKIRPTVYHEFTHVNDYATYCLNETIPSRRLIMLLYTEIHATIIEMKTATKFDNINDKKLLTYDYQMNDINGTITISKYVEKFDTIFGKSIDQFQENKTKSNFINFIKNLGYAIGIKAFCEKYVDYSVIQNNLIKAIRIFGSNIIELINIGCQENITENDIIHMANIWGGLMLRICQA